MVLLIAVLREGVLIISPNISIFIEPPSLPILIDRLTKRNTETPATLATRIERVKYELTFAGSFDHVIINDNLELAQTQAFDLVHNFLA